MYLTIIKIVSSFTISYYIWKYYNIIRFLVAMMLNDAKHMFFNMFVKSLQFDKKTNTYSANFKLQGTHEIYNLVIPNNIERQKLKLIALSDNKNVTKYILSCAGPNYDFFGFKVTPANLGLSNLKIWLDKNLFVYEIDEPISLQFT